MATSKAERNQKIVQLVKNGVTSTQISREMNITKQRISQILKHQGIKPRKIHSVLWTEEYLSMLGNCFDSHLAKRMGVSISAIFLKRKQLGISSCKHVHGTRDKNRYLGRKSPSGKLTITDCEWFVRTGKSGQRRCYALFTCKCECGNVVKVERGNFEGNIQKSCGCARRAYYNRKSNKMRKNIKNKIG